MTQKLQASTVSFILRGTSPLKEHFAKMVSTSLGRNTVWSLAGYGLRLLLQAIYFIIIARFLGPMHYGAFVATTALTGVISPFVGLGCGNLLIKNVALDRRMFSEYWGNGLFTTVVTGILFAMIAMAVCRILL